jgi:branched-chain amino acid transport system substrate-binding protein
MLLKNLATMASVLGLSIGLGVGVAQADILIAAAGPITGQYAPFGEQIKRGAEQAVQDINNAGGILGQKLVLTIGDDACDPKQAVSVANDLAKAGVVFVAGHYCSGSSIPASKVYTEEGILQISPASTNPKLTDEGGPNVFRVCGRDDQQGGISGAYIADHFKGKKIGIIHDRTAYGQGLAEETKKALNAKGTAEAVFETYTPGEKDYTALVTRLKNEKIDVLFVGGYHTEAGLIARQLHSLGMKTQLIAGDALVTDEFWSITGDAGEGTMMTFGPDPRKLTQAAPVVAAFKKANYDPEGYTLYTYAAVQVFAEAAKKAEGKTDADTLAKIMKSTDFKTVIGDLSFDNKGDIKQPAYVMYQWHNGKYAQIEK